MYIASVYIIIESVIQKRTLLLKGIIHIVTHCAILWNVIVVMCHAFCSVRLKFSAYILCTVMLTSKYWKKLYYQINLPTHFFQGFTCATLAPIGMPDACRILCC